METLMNDAKTFLSQNKKDKALLCLKKKKMYEKQVKMIEDSIFNLEMQKMNIENTRMHKSAYESFVQANSLLKDTNMDAEKVEEVMNAANFFTNIIWACWIKCAFCVLF